MSRGASRHVEHGGGDGAELLAAMRAAPDDAGPRLVYADWLLRRGDPRGQLIVLDERERSGRPMANEELDRLLALAAEHGFPKLPDDPCAGILPFQGGGSYPTQYDVDHDGHNYYLRWRYGFSIDVDHETVLECDLATLSTNEWTFRETNVILAIVSEAILRGRPLSELSFPDAPGIRAHPRFHPGRSPHFARPDEQPKESWSSLEVRDYARWRRLWARRQGLSPPPREPRCGCGVDGLCCGVVGCDPA